MKPFTKSVKPVAGMILLAIVAGAACDYLGGDTIFIEFASAEGIEKGDAVYFAGVEVGQTGSATVVGGHAQVPVYLTRQQRDALPRAAVFVVGDDPTRPGLRALLGYAVASVQARTEDGRLVYQGLSCDLELAVLLGAEKARELMEAMKRSSPF